MIIWYISIHCKRLNPNVLESDPLQKTLSIEAPCHISDVWKDVPFKLLRWFHLNNCSRPKDVKYFIKRQKSKRKNTIFAGKLFFPLCSLIIAWSVDCDPLGDDMMILHTSDLYAWYWELFHILTQNCTAILFYYKNIICHSCFLYFVLAYMFIVSYHQTKANPLCVKTYVAINQLFTAEKKENIYFWDYHYILLIILLYFYWSRNFNGRLTHNTHKKFKDWLKILKI